MRSFIFLFLLILNFNFVFSDVGTTGKKIIGDKGIYETNAQIMKRKDIKLKNSKLLVLYKNLRKLLKKKNKRKLSYPAFRFDGSKHKFESEQIFKILKLLKKEIKRSPQKISPPNFLGATLNEDPVFPPDTMGAVGPTQFIVAINGLVRSFNKSTGKRDGVLDINMDLFFKKVINPNVQTTFDPHIRYDKLSNRWFLVCDSIDIADSKNNNLLLAVSTSGVITSASGWHFFKIIPNIPNSDFFDYPTLGIDKNALYIGGDVFGPSNLDLKNISVFVVKKSSVLSTGPIVYHKFNNLFNANDSGPWLPQGVVNFDSNATVGYFISPDLISNSRLILRKIFNPGSNSPTISPNIYIPIPFFQSPINVPHKGNTIGKAGYIDGGDTRLLDSHARAGHIWTGHAVGVTNQGICPTNFSSVSRDGCRFYEIDVTSSIPKLIQSATLFQPTSTNTKSATSFIYPGIMTSGQLHMAMGCTRAGALEFINAAASGRLRTDKLNTVRPATSYTASSTSYNVMDDPTQGFRRWGDFSYSSVDPDDNMTMWTIQEYCASKNNWGVRVVKLLAPPPATPSSTSPIAIAKNQSTVFLTIIGKSIAGSGFYDPGAGFKKRIKVIISGGVKVKSVRCISPTKICLTISTVGVTAGNKDVTVINPDGQRRTGFDLLRIA